MMVPFLGFIAAAHFAALWLPTKTPSFFAFANTDLHSLCGTAGWTALCTAAQQGKVQSVSRLLEAKADPNVSNSMGAHPLFYAVSNWSLRMFRLLEKHGAKIERARRTGCSKAYAERKVTQAAAMKRFGAAYFASASCVNNSDEIDLTADWDMELLSSTWQPPEAADAIDEAAPLQLIRASKDK
eukprot:Skav223023  [mRNA]  locus=scaffold1422:190718:194757:+ [translate_table: standard]